MHWDPVTGEPMIFQAETFWSLDREFQNLAMQTPLPPVWHDVAIEGGHPGVSLQTIEETRMTAEEMISSGRRMVEMGENLLWKFHEGERVFHHFY